MCVCVCVRCEDAYGGQQCEQLLDFNILYVVPSGQKLHYVLIAAIIGAVQIAVIVAVVMCFTRYTHTQTHTPFRLSNSSKERITSGSSLHTE